MKLALKNIGKIREAEINIEGITVIAGENNTGKSTVGKTLYALCEAFHDTDATILTARVNSIARLIQNSYETMIDTTAIEPIVRSNIKELQGNSKKRQSIVQDILNEVKSFVSLSTLELKKDLPLRPDEKTIEKIERFIDLPYEALVRGLIKRLLSAEFGSQVCCVMNYDMGEITLIEDRGSVTVKIENARQDDKEDAVGLNNLLFRTGKVIYIDNSIELVEVDDVAEHRYGLRKALSANSENSDWLENLLSHEKFSQILDRLNQASGGELIKDQYDHWRYRAKNMDSSFPLKNVSTGILAFAILKRLIENGSLQENGILILDEPETHLHPEWQINFAEVIVLLRQEFNFKILINTHSYYFLHALEVFSRLHEIDSQCRFYLAEADGDMAVIEDVTGYTDKIYEKLLEPIQRLKAIRVKLAGDLKEATGNNEVEEDEDDDE